MPGAQLSKIDFGSAITTYVIFLFSLTVHEFAHAVSAYGFGDTTARDYGRITLNPVPHMNLFGTVLLPIFGLISGGFVFGYASTPVLPEKMRNPRRDDVLVSAAGPVTNLALSALGIGLSRMIVGAGLARASLTWASILAITSFLAVLNAILFIFNMLPVPPLDGSHLVKAALNEDQRVAFEKLTPFGMLIMFGAFFVLGRFIFGPVRQIVLTLALGN